MANHLLKMGINRGERTTVVLVAIRTGGAAVALAISRLGYILLEVRFFVRRLPFAYQAQHMVGDTSP